MTDVEILKERKEMVDKLPLTAAGKKEMVSGQERLMSIITNPNAAKNDRYDAYYWLFGDGLLINNQGFMKDRKEVL